MSIEIKAPQFPESVAEGSVAAWHKKPGEPIARDELMVDIETDKVVLEVVAPSDGQLVKILKNEGDTVLSAEVLAEFKAGKIEKLEPTPVVEEEPQEQPAKVSEKAVSMSSTVEIKAPQFPESVTEGTVAAWHKQVGEPVARDENIVDIETDKVVLEVVAPDSGVIVDMFKQVGDVVSSTELLANFAPGAASAGDQASQTADADKLKISPAARKLITENSLDAHAISGSGKGGLITKDDVSGFLEQSEESPKTTAPTSADVQTTDTPASASGRIEKRVPMTRLRATIARRLVEAQQTAAMLTTYNEVNMEPVMSLRSRYKEKFQAAHDGVKLGFMSFFVKASVEALKRFPGVNASIDGDEIVYHGYQDIGVAVSSDRGLVVPVLRGAESMGLADIESNINSYGEKARSGKLSIEEMTGGTFTISNGGVFGSLLSTPILNPPQTAILGMHKIEQRPVAVNGEVVILPMMYLALSYDHRMIDGKEAVQFLVTIKELLEDPARILLQV